jgi:MFS family permease
LTARLDDAAPAASRAGTDSAYAWLRLASAVMLGTIGGVGMWSVVVALPAVETAFSATRAAASLSFTLTMLGFAAGGIVIGRLVDRFGILRPVIGGGAALGLGYLAAAQAQSLWQFAAAQGLLIGFGSAATFGPLMADVSLWFTRRRGLAVAICAAGNYFAGVVWPPIVQHLIAADGWRVAHAAIGVVCLAVMPLVALVLRRPAPTCSPAAAAPARAPATFRVAPGVLQALLVVAGVACCTAMSMPQAHIVAYCSDLGYGSARGAQMLSLMLGFGIVSRIASGFVADRIGGLATLLVGSLLQGTALVLYLLFDSLASLYVVSALFGLFQGGIVPSYAIIVREYFPAREAATRVGVVLMATLIGMAFGGWISGAIFDLTGSYRGAFANGLLWNLANGAIVLALLVLRRRGGRLQNVML